jgi:hypothetical protein
MSQMIANNIKDPSFREWILPSFTTTTKCDQAVASILMMSVMQVLYVCMWSLLWIDVCNVARGEERLGEARTEVGEQTAEWYTLLKLVIS